jgi:glycosyltransferase involved in cell wall biosynthesis
VRVAVLWTSLSGYMNACLKELAGRPGVDLFVGHSRIYSDAPYKEELFGWMEHRLMWQDEDDFERLKAALVEFDPEVVVVAGWHVPLYRRIMKFLDGRALRLMTMDNRWTGSMRQRIGATVASRHVLPMADAAWVPGHHQFNFAHRIGFPIQRIVHGSLSCEHEAFSAVYEERVRSGSPLPHAFIFVGRLVESKGIVPMAVAYEKYRATTKDPWPLIVCGLGPMDTVLVNKPGIEVKGFVQPADLPNLMRDAGCLLLPSISEPWALVVNEATAVGLIVVATDKVGAVPHLVQAYHNGFIVKSGDTAGLAEIMARISAMDSKRLEGMSQASHQLSKQYTPARWADTLLNFASDFKIGHP